MSIIKKNVKRFSTREELASRIQLIQIDLTDKLNERPKLAHFNRFTKDFSHKLNDLNEFTKSQFNILNSQQQDQDNELAKLNKEIDKVWLDLYKKVSTADAQRLWRHFQRFAEYEDLRDLYKKTLPEIQKFEQRLIEFDERLLQCN